MTDFRIFCTAWFAAIGIMCALGNRGVVFGSPRTGWYEPEAMIVLATSLACAFVALFGERRK